METYENIHITTGFHAAEVCGHRSLRDTNLGPMAIDESDLPPLDPDDLSAALTDYLRDQFPGAEVEVSYDVGMVGSMSGMEPTVISSRTYEDDADCIADEDRIEDELLLALNWFWSQNYPALVDIAIARAKA